MQVSVRGIGEKGGQNHLAQPLVLTHLHCSTAIFSAEEALSKAEVGIWGISIRIK
jgi:hypothetical protein